MGLSSFGWDMGYYSDYGMVTWVLRGLENKEWLNEQCVFKLGVAIAVLHT